MFNTMKSFKNSTYEKDGSSKSFDLSVIESGDKKETAHDSKSRLNELEEINLQLANRIEEQSKKLVGVVSTNAKFLSIIAHDLRSPFSSIIGVLELLKESYLNYDQKEVERYIRMASNSAYATLGLLDNLLSWTASQNKAEFFKPVRINLQELVAEEFEDMIYSATHKMITMELDVSPKLFLNADLQMAKTILRNLITNAIKYSYIGGEITVCASDVKQFVEISVEDKGIGMCNKFQKDLFKNDNIHSTRGTNNECGTGLGLILCKEFVEKHGGKLRIESEPGKGSKIKFTLPRDI